MVGWCSLLPRPQAIFLGVVWWCTILLTLFESKPLGRRTQTKLEARRRSFWHLGWSGVAAYSWARPSISSTISFLPFSGRRHKMTYKGWRVIKPQHNQTINIIVAGKGRGFFITIIISSVSLLSYLFTLSSLSLSSPLLSLLSLSKWPARVDVSLNTNTIIKSFWHLSHYCFFFYIPSLRDGLT